MPGLKITPIGHVESTLSAQDLDIGATPRQPDEGAPPAVLVIQPEFAEGLRSLGPGSEAIVLTWLHRASRDVLTVHPRGDTDRPRQGVFST